MHVFLVDDVHAWQIGPDPRLLQLCHLLLLLLLKLDIILRLLLLLGTVELVLRVDAESLHPAGVDAALVRAVGPIITRWALASRLVLRWSNSAVGLSLNLLIPLLVFEGLPYQTLVVRVLMTQFGCTESRACSCVLGTLRSVRSLRGVSVFAEVLIGSIDLFVCV